jgi:hypothetical protein
LILASGTMISVPSSLVPSFRQQFERLVLELLRLGRPLDARLGVAATRAVWRVGCVCRRRP